MNITERKARLRTSGYSDNEAEEIAVQEAKRTRYDAEQGRYSGAHLVFRVLVPIVIVVVLVAVSLLFGR